MAQSGAMQLTRVLQGKHVHWVGLGAKLKKFTNAQIQMAQERYWLIMCMQCISYMFMFFGIDIYGVDGKA